MHIAKENSAFNLCIYPHTLNLNSRCIAKQEIAPAVFYCEFIMTFSDPQMWWKHRSIYLLETIQKLNTLALDFIEKKVFLLCTPRSIDLN